MSKLEDIWALAPLNREAAVVTGKGEHWQPVIKQQNADSDMPIPVDERKRCELFGKRRGRLVALGYAVKPNGRLVVRCDCGTYSLRTAKAIKNEANNIDRCHSCRMLADTKSKDHFRRTGKYKDWDD